MEGIKRKILSLLMCIAVVVAGFNINVIKAEAADTITIDVTGLASGAETSHDCTKYLTSKYNSAQHWQECAVCGKSYNAINHTLATMGNDSCVWSNSGQTQYCTDCGYQTTYKRSHINDTSKWCTRVDQKYHYYRCTYCNSYGSISEDCIDSKGNKITCNGGTCVVCGYTYGATHTWYNSSGGESGTVYCHKCGVAMLKYDNNIFTIASENSFNASVRITWWNTSIFGNNASTIASSINMGGTGGGVTGITSNLKTYVSGGYIYASCTVTYPYVTRNAVWANQVWQVSAYCTRIVCPAYGGAIEYKSPTIKTTQITYTETKNGWNIKALVNATLTDNWFYDPNYVRIRIVDSNKNAVSEWVTCNRNSSNNFSQSIELIGEVNGTSTYYLQAIDAGGNISYKELSITNLDSKAPTVTSSNATATYWSTNKSYTAIATDTGSGGVKIAFNNTDSYMVANQSSNTYSQNYVFTGDVYGSTIGAVYYKDALGNETTQFITISNIDNTAPTITKTSIECAANITLTVTANDNKDFGGSVGVKSGSGIAGYAVSKTNSVPSTFQTSNKLTITEDGYYYLFVKDNAGNITSKDLGYLENTKAKVTVNHYFINRTTRNYPSTPTSTNVVYEEINSQYTAPIKQVSGYDLPDLQTVKVNADGTTTVNYYYDVFKYTIYTYIDKGYGAISEKQKVEPNQNTSVYYYPANGYDVEYVRYGTSNSNLAATPIDILKVFENVQSDYYFHVAYKITETKISEITKASYNWIDLKIN